MARKIRVTPEELENAAAKIEELADEYKTQYEKLYSETDALATAWGGKDNTAFVNQISGFKDDFEKMYTLMNSYATFLRQSAKHYRDTQDTITSEAQKLVN